MMRERPPIGARVRILPGTGIVGITGDKGVVAFHHEDGVAIKVTLDRCPNRFFTVEARHVEVVPWLAFDEDDRTAASPARVGRGE